MARSRVLDVALGGVLALVAAACTSSGTGQATTAKQLTAFTWQASDSGASVVFNDHSARIFDGCQDGLRAAVIGDGVLDIGKQIGGGSTCSPATNWPPPTIARFDRVLSGHHLTWHVSGQTLRLTNEHGDTVALHAGGPALTLTGQHWALERFTDLRNYSQSGDYSSRLLIEHGTVQAGGPCDRVTGSASVTDTSITFTAMRWTEHGCANLNSVSLAEVMRKVLSGTTNYAIRGNELIIDNRGPGLLIYTPTS